MLNDPVQTGIVLSKFNSMRDCAVRFADGTEALAVMDLAALREAHGHAYGVSTGKLVLVADPSERPVRIVWIDQTKPDPVVTVRKLRDRGIINEREYAAMLTGVLTADNVESTLASEPRATLEAIRNTLDTSPRQPKRPGPCGIRSWLEISPESEAAVRHWLDQHL